MKAVSILTAVVLIVTSHLKAQIPENNVPDLNSGNWNIGVSLGFSQNFNGFANYNFKNQGFNYSIDISYKPGKNSTGIFGNYSSTSFNASESNDYFNSWGINSNKVFFYEVSAGPRFYIDEMKDVYLDAGIGYYTLNKQLTYTLNSQRHSSSSLGMNIGSGAKISLSNSISFILNGRIHYAFPSEDNLIYFGLNAGFELNENQNSKNASREINKRKFKAGILTGLSNFYGTNSNVLGAEINYDADSTLSVLVNYQYLFYPDRNVNIDENDIFVGARIHTGNNNLRFFFESLAGLLMVNSDYHLNNKNFFGLSGGLGTEFRFNNYISAFIKGNIDVYLGRGTLRKELSTGLYYRF